MPSRTVNDETITENTNLGYEPVTVGTAYVKKIMFRS